MNGIGAVSKEGTIEAISDSIARWTWNCLAYHPAQIDIATSGCALCVLFRDDRCIECPVALHTGQNGCKGTNHRKVYDAAIAVEQGRGSMQEFTREARQYT